MWRRMLLAAGVAIVAGCSTPHQNFYWGQYEHAVYGMYFEPGEMDPQTQIDLLQEDVERSEAKGLRIAPGIHAHLGYLYAMEGNIAQAKTELATEKTLFPEATVWVDGMLSRLNGVTP